MPDTPNRRVLFLSDTHMGRDGKLGRLPVSAARLRPLWQDVDHVVMNGDTAEIQMPRLRAEAARQVRDLQTFCEEDGVGVTLISGNHDAHISDTRHLLLNQQRVFITHGDVFHPAIAPWSAGATEREKQTYEAMAEDFPKTLQRRLEISQHVSHKEFLEHDESAGRRGMLWMLLRPHKVFRLLHYWARVPRWATRFAGHYAPSSQVVIFGHSHRQGIWKRGGRIVINTGCYGFPGKPWCVLMQGPSIKVYRIRRVAEGYVRVPRPVYEFSLRPVDSV